MPEYIKKNWVQWLVTFVIAMLGCIVAFSLNSKLQAKTSLENKIDSKADLKYVIQQDQSNREYTDRMVDNVKKSLDQHIQEDIDSRKTYLELLKSVDGNVKAIMNKR